MKSLCVLNMLPSKAAGESIGAAIATVLGKKIGIITDLSLQALDLAENAAAGAANAGGSVLRLGSGFESQVRTLIRHYSLDAGVFIGGGTGCIMSVYDCDGKPLDSQTESKVSALAASGIHLSDCGTQMSVDGETAYYRTLVALSESFENVVFSVESKNEAIKKIIRRISAALGGTNGEKPKFFVSSSGLCISARDEEGRVHTNDELLAVCCAEIIRSKQPLTVGFDAPAFLDELSEKNGVRLTRSFGGGDELWQNDGVFLLAFLLKTMSLRGAGLAELCRSLPDTVTRRRILHAACDLSSLADAVECGEVVVEEGRGAFARMAGGTALLTPGRNIGSFCLEVQAASSETAQELCLNFEKAINLTKTDN